VALPLTLLIGNIQLLAHPRFVRYEYGRTGFPADTVVPVGGYALSRSERTALAAAALQSIIGPEGMRVLERTQFRETGTPAFNAREIRHMRDVRWLFQWARILFWVALVVLVAGGAILNLRGRPTLMQPLLISVIVTVSIAGALGLYILLSFSSFFTQFHHAFFEGDTWLFRRDDTLIRLFPTGFWFDAAVFIAALTIGELILVGAAAWWWGRRSRMSDH
jgi:integral membrane protein (TIGR01906 family)